MTSTDRIDGAVVVTGADGHVGRAVRRRLADLPNPIRPVGRSDDWETATHDAVAVIHLAGTLQPKRPNTYELANLGTMRRTLDGVAGSSVRRVVFLSYVGAHPESDNAYLRTKGQAEQLLTDSGTPHVVVRSTFIYGDPGDIGPSFATYQSTAGTPVSVLGDGTQMLAPIHVDDLARVLTAAALDAETPTGTFEMGGPDIVSLDEFVRRLNPPGVRIRHLPPTAARLLARILPGLTPPMVEVLLADSVPAGDPNEVADRFGVTLRHLFDEPRG